MATIQGTPPERRDPMDPLIKQSEATNQSLMYSAIAVFCTLLFVSWCTPVTPAAPSLDLRGASYFHLMEEHSFVEIQGTTFSNAQSFIAAVQYNPFVTNNMDIKLDGRGILTDKSGRRYLGTIAVFPVQDRKPSLFWSPPAMNVKSK